MRKRSIGIQEGVRETASMAALYVAKITVELGLQEDRIGRNDQRSVRREARVDENIKRDGGYCQSGQLIRVRSRFMHRSTERRSCLPFESVEHPKTGTILYVLDMAFEISYKVYLYQVVALWFVLTN